MSNPTFILIASIIGFFVIALLFWAVCLWLGLKLVRSEQRRWPTILKAAVLVQIGMILINVLVFSMSDRLNPWLIFAVQLVLVIGFSCGILTTMFSLGFLRAFVAWLVTLVSQVAVVLIAISIYKPYLFEAFQAPTNSMAPTILGDHARVTCPVCGKPAYGSVHPGFSEPHSVICEQFHITEREELLRAQPDIAAQIEQEGLQPHDHFITAKYLQPQRWDMITFRLPSDPKIMYIKRLIGLPGETIVIRDGAVWANGQKLEPPPELLGIKYYLEELRHYGMHQLAGSESHPAILGSDEYFVLGDFTAAAADSRYWEKGAPDHPPYAVPADHITGVVTHLFWPWERRRSFEQH